MELRFTPGDDQWHALRKRCQTDLYYLAGVVLKYGDLVGMTEGMHKLACRVAERRTGVSAIDEKPYRLILMPRGSGKTTLMTQALAIQWIITDPTTAILLANEALGNACSYLAAIKYQFEENELFRALFPEVIPDNFNQIMWSTDQIKVKGHNGRKEPTIQCIGVGGTKTGQHPDRIIVDDMLGRDHAENMRGGDGKLTAQLNRWLAQLEPLLNHGHQPFPEILFLGTRWHLGDSYEHLPVIFGYGEPKTTLRVQMQLTTGQTQVVPVDVMGDLVWFRRQAMEQGQPVWPERAGYDLDGLAKKRLADPEQFACFYMNEPADELTATFKESWLQFYDWISADQISYVDTSRGAEAKTRSYFLHDLDRLLLVDPGGFALRSEDRMRGAIMVTGTTPGDSPQHLVLDAYSDAVPFTTLAEKILEYVVRYTPRRVYIEDVGQQASFLELVRRLATERGILLSLDRLTPKSRVKEARILGLEPYFQRGMVRLGKGAVFHELREQYRTFPRSIRCDLLDALAYGPTVWRAPRGGSGQQQQARQQAEREHYLTRRGFALRR